MVARLCASAKPEIQIACRSRLFMVPLTSHSDAILAFGMSDCRDVRSAPGCALTLLLLDAARAVEARAEGALAEIGLSLAKLGALRHLVLAAEPLTLIAARRAPLLR